MRKFHRGLGLLRLNAWKLSSDSSTRQDFLRRLQSLPLQTVHQSTRILSVSVEGTRVSVIKGYESDLNHVFTLLVSDLILSRVINLVFCSFEKSCPPRKINPLEWNISGSKLIHLPFEP